jgi:hypothetical protein
MCVRCVRVAVALRRGVDLVGLPVAIPGCPQGVGLVRVSIGLVYRRPATLGRRAAGDLAEECGEVPGSAPVAIEHDGALIAAECPFGQAQLGCHHATTRTGLGGRVPAVGTVHPGTGPLARVLNLAAEFGHRDTGDVPGQPPVAQHPGDA